MGEFTDFNILNYSKDTVQSPNLKKALFAGQAKNSFKTRQLKRVI